MEQFEDRMRQKRMLNKMKGSKFDKEYFGI